MRNANSLTREIYSGSASTYIHSPKLRRVLIHYALDSGFKRNRYTIFLKAATKVKSNQVFFKAST